MTAPALRSTRPATGAAGAPRRDMRTWLFRAAVALIAAAALAGPGGWSSLLAPVATLGPLAADPAAELHRWHAVDVAALVSLLALVPLLAALRRPRERPLLVQAGLAAVAVLIAFTAGLPPHTVQALPAGLAVIGLVVATHPAPAALMRMRDAAFVPGVLCALVAVAPFLGWVLVTNVGRQLTDLAGPHGSLGHWAGAAALPGALLVLGLLAATGRPGWRELCGILAATYGYLGASALLLPRHDGSWGSAGGLLALVAAGIYTALAARAGNHRTPLGVPPTREVADAR